MARPVYAPALVAWVGGPRVSVGVNINIGNHRNRPPSQGWYPLAPREAYVPSYRHSPTYGMRVNPDREHRGRDNRPHRNQEVVGAVTYLPGQGRPAQALPSFVGPTRPAFTPVAAPTRDEFVGVQPQPRPALPVQPVPPIMGAGNPGSPGTPAWRSEHPRDHQGRREWQRERGVATNSSPPTAAMPAMPAMPPAPAAAEVVAQPQYPQRPDENQPWRSRERGSERDRERGDRGREAMPVRAAPPQAAMPMPGPQAATVEPTRQFERSQQQQPQQPPQPQPQRVQAMPMPMPMPMPAAQLPQAQPQRAEDRGPQRPHAEGPGRGGRERERYESER